jgi:hypothetical protein
MTNWIELVTYRKRLNFPFFLNRVSFMDASPVIHSIKTKYDACWVSLDFRGSIFMLSLFNLNEWKIFGRTLKGYKLKNLIVLSFILKNKYPITHSFWKWYVLFFFWAVITFIVKLFYYYAKSLLCNCKKKLRLGIKHGDSHYLFLSLMRGRPSKHELTWVLCLCYKIYIT